MSKLLNSYEIASKRQDSDKILTNHKNVPKKKKKSDYPEFEDSGLEFSEESFVEGLDEEEIDYSNYKFSKDWRHPDGDLEYEEYSDAFIEKKQSPNLLNDTNNISNEKKIAKRDVEEIDLDNDEYEDDILMENKEEEIIKEKIEAPEAPEEIQTVHWYGNFTSYGGFSRMNRVFAFGLTNKRVVVKTDMEECDIDVNDHTLSELRYMSKNRIPKDSVKVFGSTIPLSMNHSGYKILYTMIENSEGLHIDYVDKLNQFSEIWVPTKFGKNLMEKNGVKTPIKIMPLGVDTKRYKEDKELKKLKQQSLNTFVFLSVFKWHYRKGYDLLFKAYLNEFSAEDDVSLSLITRPNHGDSSIIYNDFEVIRSQINKKDKDLPHIELVDYCVSEKDLPTVYNSANAYFTMTRGEGFCLPVVEAASCGLPIISTFNTSLTDFLREDNSFLVHPEDMIQADVIGNMKEMAKLCRFYEGQGFPKYEDASIKMAQKHLRYVFENEQEAKNKSKILTEEIRSKYSWDNAVDRVYNRLTEINK